MSAMGRKRTLGFRQIEPATTRKNARQNAAYAACNQTAPRCRNSGQTGEDPYDQADHHAQQHEFQHQVSLSLIVMSAMGRKRTLHE